MTSGAPATFSATSQIAEVEQVDQLSEPSHVHAAVGVALLDLLSVLVQAGSRVAPRARLLFEYRQWPNRLGSKFPLSTENSGWPSKVSCISQVTMLHALVLLKPQLNFDTDVR